MDSVEKAYNKGKTLGEVHGVMAFLVMNPHPYSTKKEEHEAWAKGIQDGIPSQDVDLKSEISRLTKEFEKEQEK